MNSPQPSELTSPLLEEAKEGKAQPKQRGMGMGMSKPKNLSIQIPTTSDVAGPEIRSSKAGEAKHFNDGFSQPKGLNTTTNASAKKLGFGQEEDRIDL